MKKLLLASILPLLMAVSASAVTYYEDVDLIGEKISYGETYEGEFDIAADGYDATTETVVGAVASFTIVDDGFFGDLAGETFSIDLGGYLFATGPAFFSFQIGQIVGSTLLDLDADGKLSYSVSSTMGDFILAGAALVAKADTRPVAVPDGGTTVGLLGLGLVALALYKRRTAR